HQDGPGISWGRMLIGRESGGKNQRNKRKAEVSHGDSFVRIRALRVSGNFPQPFFDGLRRSSRQFPPGQDDSASNRSRAGTLLVEGGRYYPPRSLAVMLVQVW